MDLRFYISVFTHFIAPVFALATENNPDTQDRGMLYNYIALYKMLPQYSDKTSKSKSDSQLDNISTTIMGEAFILQVSSYAPTFQAALPGYI